MVPKSDLRYLLSDFAYLCLAFLSVISLFPCEPKDTLYRGKRVPVNGSSGIFCPEASLSYFERVRFGENGFYSNHEECRDQDAATGKLCV